MARAERVACRPADTRCYPFPNPLDVARASCTPKGRCRIGWIVANSGRDSWDVWLDLHTGEGRLRRRRNERRHIPQIVLPALLGQPERDGPPGAREPSQADDGTCGADGLRQQVQRVIAAEQARKRRGRKG
jgi:hypothetical protein